jgi:gliding motility-associated-like protein
MKVLIIFTTFLLSTVCNAQLENSKWLLMPSTIFDLSTQKVSYEINKVRFRAAVEGNIVVCNAKGKMLFYSEGGPVWDEDHNLMPTSREINHVSNNGSSKGVAAIKSSKDSNIYYIVYLYPAEQNCRIFISTLDMKLRSGKGDIVAGSTRLIRENSTEAMELIPNPCGGVWILNHELKTNSFNATLVFDGKVIKTIISVVGGNPSIFGATLSRIHHNKGKVVWVEAFKNNIEIFDFDNKSGELKKSLDISLILNEPYSYTEAIFSESNIMLYVSKIENESSKIIQYDLRSNDPTEVSNSKVEFKVDYYANNAMFRFNDQIYFVNGGMRRNLGRINFPEKKGIACELDPKAIIISESHTTVGVPAELVFEPPMEIDYLMKEMEFCKLSGNIEISSFAKFDSARWSTGAKDLSISVKNDGIYSAKAYKNGCIFLDSTKVKFDIYKTFDTLKICEDSTDMASGIVYKIGNIYSDIKQNTSFICDTINQIYVTRSNSARTFYKLRSICKEEKILLNDKYFQSGDTLEEFRVGRYGYCDTILKSVLKQLDGEKLKTSGTTNTICQNATIEIIAPLGSNYNWSNGNISNKIRAKPGNYRVSYIDQNRCLRFDSIEIISFPSVILNLLDTIELILGQDYTLEIKASNNSINKVEVSKLGLSYVPINKLYFSEDADFGKYHLSITDSNGCILKDSIFLLRKDPIILPNANIIHSKAVGQNSIWKPNLPLGVKFNNLYIYDRWGNMVYTSDSSNPSWDGTSNGSEVSGGVYIYKLNLKKLNGADLTHLGTITVVK